jgi:hypothetical protein
MLTHVTGCGSESNMNDLVVEYNQYQEAGIEDTNAGAFEESAAAAAEPQAA